MTVRLEWVEDREGDGDCQSCGRTGLRWIAVLSDGSHVGVECAKRALGFKPTPKSYVWAKSFRPAREHRDGDAVFVLWERKDGRPGDRETCNGNLIAAGGVAETWRRRGWIQEIALV